MEVIASDVAAVDVSRACDGNIEVYAGDVVSTDVTRTGYGNFEVVRLQSVFQFHVSRTCHGNAVQLFCGHTYFQFIVGYADILLEADVESIVLDTDIQ